MKVIETSRLQLRPLGQEDAHYFLKYLPEIDKFLSLIAPKTREEAEQIVRDDLLKTTEGKSRYFVIEDKDSKEFIGIVGVYNIGTDDAERHCWIRKDKQGMGYAYEAICAFMEWANKNLEYDFMYSAFDSSNTAMKKLNEKLGGVPGPDIPNPVLQESGKVLNIIYYTYENPKKK
jgi:RimJ/RimL family protein N-acetyltransferase